MDGAPASRQFPPQSGSSGRESVLHARHEQRPAIGECVARGDIRRGLQGRAISPALFPPPTPARLVNLAVASVTPGLVARSGPTPSRPPLHLLEPPLQGLRYRAVSGRRERRKEKQNKQARKMCCDTRSDYGTQHRPSASQWRVRIPLSSREGMRRYKGAQSTRRIRKQGRTHVISLIEQRAGEEEG